MTHIKHAFSLVGMIGFIILTGIVGSAIAQVPEIFSKAEIEKAMAEGRDNNAGKPMPQAAALPLQCFGVVSGVSSVAFEGLKSTPANISNPQGGGEGGRFDKNPLLSTTVRLEKGTCLVAHFSAMLFSGQAITGVAPMTYFQVSISKLENQLAPRHMVGHLSFGVPFVPFEADRSFEMYASNFFQRVGNGPHEVLPGSYRVDVWWAGAGGPGGTLGAAFVLTLYQQR
jgi:hypothetical protein